MQKNLLTHPENISSPNPCREELQLVDFWSMPPDQLRPILLEAIQHTHVWHFERNSAYQRTVAARGVGPSIQPAELPLLLRPTAQTFKSYIEILGTPFPQDKPHAFLAWLAEQVSVPLPSERFAQLRQRYGSLEALLRDVERIFADFGFEVLTSSGTSGRATIMVRDQAGIARTVESFYLAFQRYFGMQADHRAVFVMPQRTRIAMARMASFSVQRVGLTSDRIHFTIPFPAEPDHVRIRAGRTYRPGLAGRLERRILNPFANWMNDHYVTGRAVRESLTWMEKAEAAGEKLLLFGGWIQLHAIALEIQRSGKTIRLAPGSLLGTGGGFKELYPFNQAQIRQDLQQAIQLNNDEQLPIRDVYGMAEGNWAAMQCRQGNYHIPPWVYAVTLDEDNRFQETMDSTGLLAFFDPYGGGQLFPAFFKTADRVRLVRENTCPCGDRGAYIAQASIQRVDLVDEAGCAAQI